MRSILCDNRPLRGPIAAFLKVEINSGISLVSKHCSIFGRCAGQTNSINFLQDQECCPHHGQTVHDHKDCE